MEFDPEIIEKITEKAQNKLSNVSRFNPYTRRVLQQSDWVESLKASITGFAQIFDNLTKSLKSLTEAVDKEAFVQDFKRLLDECVHHSALLSLQHCEIIKKYLRPASIIEKQKVDRDLQRYWERLDNSIQAMNAEVKSTHGRAKMLGVWDELSAMHPLIARLETIDLSMARANLLNGELILGDDMEEFEPYL